MNERIRYFLLVTLTGLMVAVLGSFNGCDGLIKALTDGGETVRMQPVRITPEECDTRFGDALATTLPQVPSPSDAPRLLFIGNSQQYTASLPRGAGPVERQAELAAVLFTKELNESSPRQYSVYVAAAPNQNFGEALWQGIYWFRVSSSPPAALFLQASFDTFRKSGVRPGFQTLLDDTTFETALREFERNHPDRAWAADFVGARRDKDERERAAAEQTSKKKTVEGRLRSALVHLPLFRRREELRASFLNALYLTRVHALGISPTTRRHITGQPLELNFDALEDLADLARSRGTAVFIYNAPVNPEIDMFYPEEYAAYLRRLQDLADRRGAHFADLASSVDSQHWGFWVDAPDPIHFDELGHRALAKALLQAFGEMLKTDGIH